jgi:Flp pilus assembly protein TadD
LALLLTIASLVEGQTNSFDDELRRGLLALKHNPAEARQPLEHASQLQPGNAKVWAALAQAYLGTKQTDLAKSAAQKAETLGEDDPVVQHTLAMFFSETGDLSKAAAMERRFASSKTADPQAAARAARLSLDAGDAKDALTWAQAALERADTADLHHLAGISAEAAQEPETAFAELRRAVEAAPYDETFNFDLGQALLRHGDFAAALDVFAVARKRFPKSPQIELAYGVAAYGQRRFHDAIEAFLHVTELDPSIQQPYVFIGRILENADDLMPRVLTRYAAWTAAEPGNYLAWFLHAKALDASSGDPDASLSELHRSIALNPNFWEAHLELGIVLMQRRQWQDASAELSRAIALDKDKPAPHFQLARAYKQLGKLKEAQAELAEFKRLSASETDSPVP